MFLINSIAKKSCCSCLSVLSAYVEFLLSVPTIAYLAVATATSITSLSPRFGRLAGTSILKHKVPEWLRSLTLPASKCLSGARYQAQRASFFLSRLFFLDTCHTLAHAHTALPKAPPCPLLPRGGFVNMLHEPAFSTCRRSGRFSLVRQVTN